MNVVDVRAVQPEAPGAPPDWRTWMGQILVRVDTADGLTGYGVGGGGLAGMHVVQTALKTLLLGQDATAVETLWQRMYRATLAYGQKGLALGWGLGRNLRRLSGHEQLLDVVLLHVNSQ